MYPNQSSLLIEKKSNLETPDNSTKNKTTEPSNQRDSNVSQEEGRKNAPTSSQSSPLKNLLNLK